MSFPSHRQASSSPPSDVSSNTPCLLCLDFDLTLTQVHLFSYTAESIRSGFSREDSILRAIKLLDHQGPRGGEEFWDILYHWLAIGHGIAITSFTSFPELPIAFLSRGVIHLRKRGATRALTRWLSRPIVIYGDPAPDLNPPHTLPGTWLISPDLERRDIRLKSQTTTAHNQQQGLCDLGKNRHIDQALKVMKDQGHTFKQAVLMDDDPRNIKWANERGYFTIPVSHDLDDQKHLDLWRTLIETHSLIT